VPMVASNLTLSIRASVPVQTTIAPQAVDPDPIALLCAPQRLFLLR